jgi:hypothetical protein
VAETRDCGERPPLEAITRKMVKTQQSNKAYMCAVVNCRASELAIALWLLVVMSGVRKCAINLITD